MIVARRKRKNHSRGKRDRYYFVFAVQLTFKPSRREITHYEVIEYREYYKRNGCKHGHAGKRDGQKQFSFHFRVQLAYAERYRRSVGHKHVSRVIVVPATDKRRYRDSRQNRYRLRVHNFQKHAEIGRSVQKRAFCVFPRDCREEVFEKKETKTESARRHEENAEISIQKMQFHHKAIGRRDASDCRDYERHYRYVINNVFQLKIVFRDYICGKSGNGYSKSNLPYDENHRRYYRIVKVDGISRRSRDLYGKKSFVVIEREVSEIEQFKRVDNEVSRCSERVQKKPEIHINVRQRKQRHDYNAYDSERFVYAGSFRYAFSVIRHEFHQYSTSLNAFSISLLTTRTKVPPRTAMTTPSAAGYPTVFPPVTLLIIIQATVPVPVVPAIDSPTIRSDGVYQPNAPLMSVMLIVVMTGHIIGITIDINDLISEAPSSSALSRTLSGSLAIDEVK